jgi:hypothetical protein
MDSNNTIKNSKKGEDPSSIAWATGSFVKKENK